MKLFSDSSQTLFTRQAESRLAPEINLIAFIDVLLVILIFLMISTTFTKYQELSITLPEANGVSATSKSKELNVAITADGRIALNGKRVAYSQLDTQMNEWAQQLGTQAMVIIAADGKAPHQAVMQVMEAARNANLPNIVFATQSKSK